MSTQLLRGLRDPQRSLGRELLTKGWRVRRLRNGHLRMLHPNGRDGVTIPSTSVSQRGFKNLCADVRRIERAQ